MENRRLFIFLLSTMTFLWLWTNFVAPPVEPPADEAAAVADAKNPATEQASEDVPSAADTTAAAAPDPQPSAASAGEQAAGQPAATAAAAEPQTLQFPDYQESSPVLGSLEADSGYGLQVQLTSIGGSVQDVWLTSPQFRDLQNPNQQVQLIGNNLSDDRTFTLALNEIDRLLRQRGATLEMVHWKLAESGTDKSGSRAVFEYDSPDGQLRLRKI